MKWLVKALAFKAFSFTPGGQSVYRYIQIHWTKSIVATAGRVAHKMDIGMRYLTWLMSHGYEMTTVRKLRHLDLGSGWHPTIPLLFSKIGMQGQVLTDVSPVMSDRTFRESLVFVNQLLADPKHPAHGFLQDGWDQQPSVDANFEELLEFSGMEYHAPYFEWANKTDRRFDLATCTQVLMHIERPNLDQLFQLIHGLLRPGGLFMSTVHLFDIYSNSDSRISIYNHLKYSKSMWSTVVNSDMMTFNRLKSRDYREALEGAGFEIVEFEINHGGPDDLRSLRSVKVHPEFTERYSEEELAEKHLFLVVRKP